MKNPLTFIKSTYVEVVALGLFMCTVANAGGVIGDIINTVVPGAGTTLDEAHRRIKDVVPPYKAIEEGASKTVNEAFVQQGAPLLQELIARSRDDALRNGVLPIPPDIRRNLNGFISERVLNAAQYRVQGGGDLTLQVNSIRYGEAQAITLDYVIVFKELGDALYNPTLWAHELTHVDQYQRWGIKDFSIQYLRDYEVVEREAYEAETRFVAWASLQNTQSLASRGDPINAKAANRPVYQFSQNRVSSTCGTAVAVCQVNGSAPAGTACWCNTAWGAAIGSLIPDNSMGGTPNVDERPMQANACTTPYGSCPLGVKMSAGSQCTCFTQQGNFPGSAQQKNLGGMCHTSAGSCQLTTPLFSGDPCYCPSPMGPRMGQVP